MLAVRRGGSRRQAGSRAAFGESENQALTRLAMANNTADGPTVIEQP